MQARVSLLHTDVMPIFIIIALNMVITVCFSVNWSTVICSSTVLFAFKREASSETYGPGSIFHHISFQSTILQSFIFRSINQKPQKYFIFCLVLFIYLYQISPLQVTVKGLTTPLSCWVQVFDCLCRYWWFARSCPTGLLPWFLTEGNTYLYFAASPFPLQGKNQRKLKS